MLHLPESVSGRCFFVASEGMGGAVSLHDGIMRAEDFVHFRRVVKDSFLRRLLQNVRMYGAF